MKISVVARASTWHTDQLKIEAKKAGVDFEVVNIKNLTRLREKIDTLGEVVIWRSSTLDLGISRTVFVDRLSRHRIVINSTVGKLPFVAHKLYQQKMVEPLKTVLSIPTYNFKSKRTLLSAVDKGILKFPMIMKANLGARGQKVYLMKNREELEALDVKLKDYVFQNFIKNSGDYRVFVLGGVVLGVIKRIAKDGEYRNNVSQGGTAVDARSFPEAEELADKALTVASMFGLNLCGVDFIQDDETGEFHFLEINTVVQWRGFQEATGINVAEKIVKYAASLANPDHKQTPQLVSEYFEDFGKFMPASTQLHYLSRRFWWTGEEKYRRALEELPEYSGNREQVNAKQKIESLVHGAEGDLKAMKSKEQNARRLAYATYPRVMVANYLLFFWFMTKKIYGVDWHQLISEVISDDEIRMLRTQLTGDDEGLRGLATGAVNFFYLSAEYLNLPRPDLEWLLEKTNRLSLQPIKGQIRPWMYSLTHMIIGESLFYTRPVEEKDICQEILKRIETEISKHFFKVSIDIKMEFLVCCKLADYKSKLATMIMQEADNSLSPLGNFLVDTINKRENRHTHKLFQAEHRNVLYLLASSTGK